MKKSLPICSLISIAVSIWAGLGASGCEALFPNRTEEDKAGQRQLDDRWDHAMGNSPDVTDHDYDPGAPRGSPLHRDDY